MNMGLFQSRLPSGYLRLGLLAAASWLTTGLSAQPVINEYQMAHVAGPGGVPAANSVVYVELYSTTAYATSTTLVILGGDSGRSNNIGRILEASTMGTFLAGETKCYQRTDPPAPPLTGDAFDTGFGSRTFLLVTGYTGTLGVNLLTDLDSNNDGVIDQPLPWGAVVDGVAIWDGGKGDYTFEAISSDIVRLNPTHDPLNTWLQGASRVQNDPDTDTVSDWTRNSPNGAGLHVNFPSTANPSYTALASPCYPNGLVNNPPIITAIPDQTVDELLLLTVNVVAVDPDVPATALTYSVLPGAPAGLSINPATGVISWTPTEAQGPGLYSVTVQVTDSGFPLPASALDTFTITVNEVNVAPVLGAIGGPFNINEDNLANLNETLAFTATATDVDVPVQSLTFSLGAGAPAGATINPTTGAFAFAPSESQGGSSFVFAVIVTDNGPGNLSDSETITINIAEVNENPVLDAIGNKTVDEGNLVTFDANASDIDLPVQALTFSAVGLPAGASIDPGTGVFTWTPSEAQGPGAYNVTIVVTDNGTPNLQDSEAITITVNDINNAPTLAAIGNKTIDELANLTFTASATDSDLPAQTLTFSLDAGAPAGASINPATGAFNWTPTEAQGPGTYPVTVRVTDNGVPAQEDFETIQITVNEVNLAPVLAAIGNKTTNELAAVNFTASATDADLPAQALTFSLDVGAPAGASINPVSGAFTWTPSEAQGPGVYNVTVRVTDNGSPNLDDSETIQITVNEINNAPVLGSIGNKTIDELAVLSFTATATDGDLPAQTLTFSLDGGAPAGASINPVTGLFSWSPTEAQGPGSYPVTVRVTDNGPGLLSDSETITVTVNEVNTAPVLAFIANATIPEQTPYTFTASATDSDLPANTLTFSLTGAPAGAVINPSTGVFDWTPTEAQGPGVYTFDVVVTDNGTPVANDSQSITLTVQDVNVAPVLAAVGNKSVDEGSLLTFTATATDADLPAQTLTFSLDGGAPAGASITAGGVFSWTPTEIQGPGVYPVTIRVTDNGAPNLNDFETINITVNEVNAAPVLAAIGPKSVNETNLLTFTATATDVDLPANSLTFSLDGGAPAGSSITAGGVFTWTPSEAQGPGVYPVTVRVTDNGTLALDDFETINITVNEINNAPVLAAIGNKTVDETNLLTFTATAVDGDLPANTLTYTLDAGAPAGASITAGGVFTWTPTEAQGPGLYSVTVRVTDNGVLALDDSETIQITVNEVNNAPVLAAIGNKTVDELVNLAFTASATDADVPANTLTFSLSGAPIGAAIDPVTGAFSWTPTEAQGPGPYTFSVVVTDNGTPNLNDSESITVTVNEINLAPVLALIPNATIPEQTLFNFTASATDADLPANTLTYSLVGAPAGASINPATGLFAWNPTEPQGPGVYSFDVVVTDNGTPALQDSQTVTITVNDVNVAPVLGAVGNKSVNELATLGFTLSVTDADLPPQALTFSMTGAPVGATLDPVTGVFSWTPTEAQGPGTYNVTFKVTDDGIPALEDSEAIVITVNEVNAAPVLAAIGNKTTNELVAVSFTASATDADLPANSLTFSLAGAPAGASINPATGAFTWTPTEAQGPNSYTFDVVVTDNGTPNLSDFETITITVNEVNQAPVLAAVGNKSVNELVNLAFSLSATDADLPAQTLTYTMTGAPAGATLNPTTGAFSWTPTEAQGPGTYNVTFKVADNGSPVGEDTEAITITVNEINVAPVLAAIGNKTTDELVAVLFTASATDADLPANTLAYSLTGAPAGAAIDPVTGAFTWTPTEAQGPGNYTFDVVVTDNGTPTLTDSETITITVNEVNQAPVLAAIGNKSVDELDNLAFSLSATDADLPAQSLTYSMTGAPAGATLNPGSGAFSWTPTEAQGPGTYNVTFKVSDNGTPVAEDTETITITVNELNVAPVLAPIGDKSINELANLAFPASATDADLPAQTLTFSLDVGAPAGASIDPLTGAFSWTPTEAQGPGVYPVTIRVKDSNLPAGEDFETINITVNEVNLAPVMPAIGAKSVNELVNLAFSIASTDADVPANTLSYSMVGAPAGATLDPSTGAFSWTPTEAQGPGVYPVQFIVTDNGVPVLTDSETINITVNEVNIPPVLAPIGNKSIDELSNLAFSAVATDGDLPAQTLTFSVDAGAPAGLTINPVTGAFSWTPSEAQGPGIYTVTIRVTDNGSPVLDDSEVIEITVNEVNNAPVLAAIGNKTVDETVLLTFTATATDSDLPVQTLTYSIDLPIPPGASIDPLTGVFSWTPTESQGGSVFNVTIRVTDSALPALSDFETITITVNDINLPPVLAAIGNKTVDELVPVVFTATATDTDLPSQTLTYSLDVGAPAGATIDGVTGQFTWIPTEAQGPGSFPITVRVTDNGVPALNDFETITITVNEVNIPPVLAPIGNRTVDEGSLLTINCVATDGDIPANTLTFSLEAGAPVGAAIHPVTGVFTWTPNESHGPGFFTVTIKVTDNGTPVLDDIETIIITVNELNQAPVLAAVGNKTVDEMTLLSFTASATDADLPGNTLVYSLDGGAPAGAAIDSASGAFTWTPTEAQGPGSYNVTIRVTDNGVPVLNDFETITITVNEVNLAPVLAAIGDKSVDELVNLGFSASATDADLPVNTLTYSLDVGAPAGASINPVTGAFTWTPTEAQGPGVYPVTVRVTDNGTPALNDFETINITVNEINLAPVLAPVGNKTVDELVNLAFVATATDADLPANTLTFSLDAGAPVGASIDPVTGAFSWTPTEAQGPGAYPVTVRVTDNGSPTLSDFEVITITVNEINLAPVLAPIGNFTLDELTNLAFTASATDADLPANTLTFTLDVGAPAGATINPVTGAFSWTPSEAQGPGVYPITVRVTDNGVPSLNDFEAISVTVNEVNICPTSPDQAVSTNEDIPLAINITATDPDLPPNALVYTILTNPTFGVLSGVAPLLTYTPDLNYYGPDIFTFSVNDGAGCTVTSTVDITVIPVNDPPVIGDIRPTYFYPNGLWGPLNGLDPAVWPNDYWMPVAVPVTDDEDTVDQITLEIIAVGPAVLEVSPQLAADPAPILLPRAMDFDGLDHVFNLKVAVGTPLNSPDVWIRVRATDVGAPPASSEQTFTSNTATTEVYPADPIRRFYLDRTPIFPVAREMPRYYKEEIGFPTIVRASPSAGTQWWVAYHQLIPTAFPVPNWTVHYLNYTGTHNYSTNVSYWRPARFYDAFDRIAYPDPTDVREVTPAGTDSQPAPYFDALHSYVLPPLAARTDPNGIADLYPILNLTGYAVRGKLTSRTWGDFDIGPIALETYTNWAKFAFKLDFADAAKSGRSVDHPSSNDGVLNWVAYAIGLDPVVDIGTYLPGSLFTAKYEITSNGDNWAEMSYLRNPQTTLGVGAITYTIQFVEEGDDPNVPASWQDASANAGDVYFGTHLFEERILVPYSIPALEKEAWWIRARVKDINDDITHLRIKIVDTNDANPATNTYYSPGGPY